MTSTLAATGVKLGDGGLAARLGALEFLLRSIGWWMASKQLEGKVFVLLSLLRSQCVEPLKFDEGFGTVSPAFVEQTSDDDDTVDLSS